MCLNVCVEVEKASNEIEMERNVYIGLNQSAAPKTSPLENKENR